MSSFSEEEINKSETDRLYTTLEAMRLENEKSIEFAKKVQQMRIAQINYFNAAKKGDKAGKDHWRPIAMTLEKEVDRVVIEIIPPTTPLTHQPSLF